MKQGADGLEVIVEDNGQGVPPEDHERIFQPYQRSRPQGGLTASIGVGVTVARRLARLMGGEPTYRHTGGHSEFTIALPQEDASALVEEKLGAGR